VLHSSLASIDLLRQRFRDGGGDAQTLHDPAHYARVHEPGEADGGDLIPS
jgi:hypothetical protein